MAGPKKAYIVGLVEQPALMQKVAIVRSILGRAFRPNQWSRRAAIDLDCSLIESGYEPKEFEDAVHVVLFGKAVKAA